VAPLNDFARVTASMLGTLPVAVLAAMVVARYLPARDEVRLAVGFLLLIPLWVTGICTVFLARSGGRAWLRCLVLAGILAFLALR
jgi:hypothetical protein